MIIPPWLALPIKGFGGIELVVQTLVDELLAQGIQVEIFGNGARTMPGVKTHSLYKTEQIENINRPYTEALPLVLAHMQFSLNKIRQDGGFDIIHDHNELIGPQFWALASQLTDVPPVLHTLHVPPSNSDSMNKQGIPERRTYLELLSDMGNMYIVSISDAMTKMLPEQVRHQTLEKVYNAIDPDDYPYKKDKKDYFMTLARFSALKAQHVAAKLCESKGYRLRMAGTVAGIESNKRLLLELGNKTSSFNNFVDFRYYRDEVLPYVHEGSGVTYEGNMSGGEKLKFISEAKALLFPIDWEEPFGMAVIEALACGTPVVAMNRGALPEIITHGVNGFLANNESEFSDYMDRVDEIDPQLCRDSVAERFSTRMITREYINRYEQVIKLTRASRASPV
jgi:glycosyltransferase involved in cell wall biosynthesis